MVEVTLYTAPWCNPCKSLKEQWKSFAPQPEDSFTLTIVDIDFDPEKGMQAGIRGVPTTTLSRNGEEYQRLVGMYAIPQLIERIKHDEC